MAIPECSVIPGLPPPKDITFPGGATLSQVLPAGGQIPDPLDAVTNLLAQASPAMAPLVPVFDIIGTIIAIVDCIKAIPASLGPPPDPAALVECLEELGLKVDGLLKLIPQLSVPLLVVGIVDCLIDFLNGLLGQLQPMIRQFAAIAEASTKAAELEDANLEVIVKCSGENLDAQLAAMNDSLTPMNRLIGLLNIFLGLIGLPEVPDLGTLLDAGDPAQALQPLEEVVKLLTDVRDAVPVP